MNFGKKDEDSAGGLTFDKSTILQETRVFNESPLNARKCRLLLAKVLALLYMGESFGAKEATEVFFATTKLFQCKDPALRQMIYLIIKELSNIADDVIMVTSSLTKDINAKPEELFSTSSSFANAASQFGFKFGSGASLANSLVQASGSGVGGGAGSVVGTSVSHRACAIRALSKITDPVMLQAIERFLKQAIVDKNASVSSAAIVSSYHLFNTAKDVVKRWGNEVQEAINSNKSSSGNLGYYSGSNMTQYHALGLLYLIRQHDRMAVAKLLQGLAKSNGAKNQWAQCMLIRFAVKCMEDESVSFGGKNMVNVEGSLTQQLYEFLKSLCNNKEMVMLEAARALCNMASSSVLDQPGLSSQQLYPAVQALAQLLNSSKPALKFAALRTLNKLAMTNPSLVGGCNLDMEQLITDSNRSIATYAITTLLKTGTESSVDRLMKQISTFMNEISDEFKVIIIDAIRALALKFPSKQSVMLGFLSGVLRDEGGYEYKKSIVEAIFDLVKTVPECKETALAHLCEFIEDCEFTKLSVRILHLLGVEGPKTLNPTNYIRYIYNRVILENSNVRAAATSALAHFGCKLSEDIRRNVKVLLKRCLDDTDDEVRDRATFYLRVLENDSLMSKFLLDETMPSLSALEAKLVNYKNDPNGGQTAFDVKAVPIITKSQEEEERMRAKTFATQNVMSVSKGINEKTPSSHTSAVSPSRPIPMSSVESMQMHSEELAKIPEFAPIVNTLFKSSPRPIDLTEQELEYVVSCVKHVFTDWVVFQFNCKNTLQDSLLENVTVQMLPETEDVHQMMQQQFIISAKRLIYNEMNKIYVAFKKVPGSTPFATFQTTLKYVIKDCDPNTFEPDSDEGYDDVYQLEEVDLSIVDYMVPSAVPDFSRMWEELGQASEILETFQIASMPSLAAAVTKLIDLLGMQPVENTQTVPKDRNAHMLVMSGVFMPNVRVLVRVRMAFETSTGVTMEFAVRSEALQVSELVAAAIG